MASTSYLKNAPLKDKMPESWDVEVCLNGEADLYKHLICQKHPGHKKFIPVDTFDITHLPTDYQYRDIVEYIKLVAQLTVQLTVRYVSPDRPATVPGTDTPYPGYQNRGRMVTSYGTGVIRVPKYGSDEVLIETATHVVFDNQEAQQTSCHLFYDNGGQPGARNTSKELKGGYVVGVGDTIADESLLSFYIFDKSLLNKLELISKRLFELQNIIKERFVRRSNIGMNKPLTFIVSHPHGCSKTISIGRCVEVDDNLDDVRILYNTPTCPGSSGAAVICLDKLAWNFKTVHSGAWKNETNVNIGSCGYASSKVPVLYKWESWMWQSPNLRLTDRRSDSLPLPPELSYNLVEAYIWSWIELCVFTVTNYVSEQRPEFWPGSELPYPWYNKRGSREERNGGGWVDRVYIYPNQWSPDKTCDCDTCWISSTPERQFAHIYIQTSTSLIFDQTEGTKTTCSLYSPKLDRFSGTLSVCSNVETDRSQLVFVTHNRDLAEALNNLLEYVSILKDKIQEKFSSQLSENLICIKIDLWRKITIIQGDIVGKHLVYTNEAKDNDTDIGAAVILLGNKNLDVSGHTRVYPHHSSSRIIYDYNPTKTEDRQAEINTNRNDHTWIRTYTCNGTNRLVCLMWGILAYIILLLIAFPPPQLPIYNSKTVDWLILDHQTLPSWDIVDMWPINIVNMVTEIHTKESG